MWELLDSAVPLSEGSYTSYLSNVFYHYVDRLILHESVYDEVLEKLKKSYASIMKRKGDPMDEGTLYGPLHSQVGVAGYMKTLEDAKNAGGKVVFGGKIMEGEGNYVMY